MANEIEVLETFEKQPNDVQDYDINYTRYLRGLSDTPQSFEVVVPTGITLVASSLTGNVVKVWLSGGTAGAKYKITTRLTTVGGRVKEAEITIHVKEV